MLGGFHFKETMSGTFTPESGAGERAIRFTITARARSWLKHLRDHKAEISGELDMEGFATRAPISGELTINPLLGKVIRYEFEFTGDDRKHYRFAGQKDVTIADPVGSMTTLPATITDGGGRTVATCNLRFDTRDLPGFLGSFRPW
jgi:hypothetical protein